jgi:hypothetical protein
VTGVQTCALPIWRGKVSTVINCYFPCHRARGRLRLAHMVLRPLPVSRPSVALLVWVAAMTWSCGTFAEIYKWVDQKGVTNYSSSPPAAGKARTLDLEATMVSVYRAPSPQEEARALDAIMRQKVAMLEYQLQAERTARLSQQASYRTDAGLAYEQCLRERRVDCDSGRSGAYGTPYFFSPGFPVARPFRSTPFITPMTPFTRNAPIMAGFSPPAGGSTRIARHRGSSRKF